MVGGQPGRGLRGPLPGPRRALGSHHVCAVTTAGRAYCWGTDTNGQLGNGSGTSADQVSPSPVDTSTGLTTTNVAKLTSGQDHTCAVTTTGQAYCWGWDNYGELGNGSTLTADQVSPSPVG